MVQRAQLPLILYHANCYDGFGAAYAAWLKYRNNAEYKAVNYGEEPPDVEGREVYVLDFSYPRLVLLSMNAQARSLRVFDHHATAARELHGLAFCTFDMSKSGAVLAWEHFHPDQVVPLFFLYLQDRDLWRFELPGSRGISYALRAYPMDFLVWDQQISLEELAEEGKIIITLNEQNVREICKHARSIVLGGQRMPCVNTSLLFSECADFLLHEHNVDIAAYYFDRADKRQWGLRSREYYDCSTIAREYGGGGHPQAAGFVSEINWLPPDDPMKQ